MMSRAWRGVFWVAQPQPLRTLGAAAGAGSRLTLARGCATVLGRLSARGAPVPGAAGAERGAGAAARSSGAYTDDALVPCCYRCMLATWMGMYAYACRSMHASPPARACHCGAHVSTLGDRARAAC
eukprot:scaffold1216_cov357-Prasinococcus_capsulatus_cf.AAC.11